MTGSTQPLIERWTVRLRSPGGRSPSLCPRGPGVSYRHVTQANVTVDTGLRIDAVADIEDRYLTPSGLNTLHARVEGTLDFLFPGGARTGLAIVYDGIGANRIDAISAKLQINFGW